MAGIGRASCGEGAVQIVESQQMVVRVRHPCLRDRRPTIANIDAVQRYGVKAEGNAAGASASVLAELTELIAAGQLEIPLAGVFPLDKVQDAYRELAEGHTLGKIVLLP